MKTIRQAKWAYILCSILFCITGTVLIIYPAISARVISYIVGVVSILYGLSKILGYLSEDMYFLAFQFDLALGIFVSIIGIIFLLQPGRIISFLPFLIGLFVIIDGVFKVQTSVDARRFGLREWWLILVGAIICLGFGIFLLCDSIKGGEFLTVVMGIALLINGLQNLFNALYTIKISKKGLRGSSYYIEIQEEKRY